MIWLGVKHLFVDKTYCEVEVVKRKNEVLPTLRTRLAVAKNTEKNVVATKHNISTFVNLIFIWSKGLNYHHRFLSATLIYRFLFFDIYRYNVHITI